MERRKQMDKNIIDKDINMSKSTIVDEVHNVPLSDIRVGKSNVRRTDRNVGIDELKENIREYGLLQPVLLRGIFGNPPYDLIVGQRRFLAHKELGERNIRAVFRDDLSDTSAKIISLTANMHRVDLNHADKATAINALYEECDNDIRELSRKLGLSQRTLREYIKIEEQATPKGKEMLKGKKIKKTDLKRVIAASQGDTEKADKLLDLIKPLSKYEKDRAVEYGKMNINATADEIIEESKKPKLERTVILNLLPEIADALEEAEKKLLMSRELIASKALSEWLRSSGFLKNEVEK